jgi:hypothetical protein
VVVVAGTTTTPRGEDAHHQHEHEPQRHSTKLENPRCEDDDPFAVLLPQDEESPQSTRRRRHDRRSGFRRRGSVRRPPTRMDSRELTRLRQSPQHSRRRVSLATLP